MPRMVGEKSSIVPVAIGGIIIAAVAVAVWYATRGSQTEEVPVGGSAPSALMTPPRGPEAASDNAISDNAISDNEVSGNEAANNADNTASGAMGAENSLGANATGADNSMDGAGANSADSMNGAGNSVSPMTGATPMGGAAPMTGTNAMPVPPPITNQ